jgi:glycosyltransferase involved in cell wall biosynthesis
MKIVFSIKNINHTGGTERVTTILSKALSERGHEVHIVSFTGADQEPFFEIDKRVKLHYLAPTQDKYPFPIRDIRRIKLMRSLYKEIQPDIILIVDAGRSLVNIPASKGYKVITWEHFNVGINWHLGHRLSRKIAAKYSDLIVTLTQPDATAYKEKFKAKNAICIYNPVTINASEPSKMENKICLAIGRLVAQKNFIDVNDAYSVLSDPKKKSMYDQGVDPLNPEEAQGMGGFGMGGMGGMGIDLSEIFNMMGGGGGIRFTTSSGGRGGRSGGFGGFGFPFGNVRFSSGGDGDFPF